MLERTLWTKTAGIALAVAFAAGCNGNPGAGSAAYKEGELGNGAFLFACDDGVACLPYSGDAKKFPTAIATGSTFDVRFVDKDQQGTSTLTVGEKKYEGIKPMPVEPFITAEPSGGFLAKKAGYATIMARDATNTVVDYVTVKVVQPKELAVYDATATGYTAKNLTRIQSVRIGLEDRRSYRVVATPGQGQDALAGSIPVEWTSDDPSIVEIESYSQRVVNIHALKSGTTTLTAAGAGLEKKLTVEVSQ